MKLQGSFARIEFKLILVIALCTVIVTPDIVWDSVNLPKLVVLSAGAFGLLLCLLYSTGWGFLPSRDRIYNLIILILIIDLVIVLVFSGSNFSRSFYGTSGRNTGFLSYLLCLIILFVVSRVTNLDSFKKFTNLLCGIATVTSIYGVMQKFDLDLINWQNKYGPVIGFFGNPNFMSGFLGIAAVASIILFVSKETKPKLKLVYLLLILLEITVIRFTQSSQGFFILLAGLFSFILINSIESKKKNRIIVTSIFTIIGAFAFLSSLFSIGPFGQLVLDSGIFIRRVFWDAAIGMTKSNPLIGVGFDGYIDWYRKFRPLSGLEPNNIGIYTDSSHNIFLDISSSGGFPLLILYILLQVFVLVSLVRILQKGVKVSPNVKAISSCWVGYQVYSLVGINNLGIMVWGWIFAGLIIGYEINSRVDVDKATKNGQIFTKRTEHDKDSPHNFSNHVFLVGMLIGGVVSIPVFLNSAHYVSALKSGNKEEIKSTAVAWPVEEQRLIGTVDLFVGNKMDKDALEIAHQAIKSFPNSSFAWEALMRIPGLLESELNHAKSELRRLDPNNPKYEGL